MMKKIFAIFSFFLTVGLAAQSGKVVLDPKTGGFSKNIEMPEVSNRRIVIMDQRFDQGVNLGLNPSEDSVYIAECNRMMDSIRLERPTVGLVLSGGGAKGAAHVGVIRYLESINMPVDLVVGTSMGGLVGGLKALGYNAHQMDSIIRAIDWDLALSDNIDRKYKSYKETKYRERYLISFPFYYLDDDIADTSRVVYASGRLRKNRKFDIGADDEPVSLPSLKDKLIQSIPSGFVYGHNVLNILNGLSVGYQDSLNFNRLPVPFACVATDLVSGKGKVWHNGNLVVAMRSTMSIPGIFAPVKVDSLVLVDGGMRDNYPCDLARRMGADIIIGVDLSSGFGEYQDVNNLLDIINSGIDMMGREAYELNVNVPDVSIKPELTGYNMMSFGKENIDIIIERGYQAALDNAERLAELKAIVGDGPICLNAPPAKNITSDSVYVADIIINGVTPREKSYIMEKAGFSAGEKICRAQIENAEAILLSTKAFDNVTYQLSGKEEPYTLIFDCKRGPVHTFGFGAKFDSEEIVSSILHLGLFTNRIQGSSFDVEMRVAGNPHLKFLYSYDSPKAPTFNAGASVKWTDMELLDYSKGNRLNLCYLNASQEIYMSNIKFKYLDIKLGLKNELWYSPFNDRVIQKIDSFYVSDIKLNDYVSLYLNARGDTFDNGYFPKKGVCGGLSYKWVFAGLPAASFDNFHSLTLDVKAALSIGEHFTFLPSLDISALIGGSIPYLYGNFVGGSMRGRYLSQQIPFMGVNGLVSVGPYLGVLNGDFRFMLARNHYLSGIVGYVRASDSVKTYFSSENRGNFGACLEYAYNSFVGPVSINLHWSDLIKGRNKFGVYVNLGFMF